MTEREPGFYWVKDRGNPHLLIMEWSPECGQRGLWHAAGVDGGFDPEWITVCSDRIIEPQQQGEPSQEQVQAMVDVWREWSAQTPGLRPSVNTLMRRAYGVAKEMEASST